MTYHSPPAMIAIGLLGDEADRYQLATTRWNPMATAQEDAGTTDLAEAGDTRAHSHVWGMLTAQRTIRPGGVQMTRLERGFYDGNGEFVTADERVECRLGGRGTVNAIFQGGEAEVMFDDDADLSLVKWDHIWKLPSWAQKT
jgi:hypothetical protein